MIPSALARLALGFRLARAKLRHSTVRFPARDLPALYEEFDRQGIPYVVLRWADDVPLTDAEARRTDRDIDHLIGRDVIGRVLRIASRRYGSIKCDYYSVGGQRGTAYLGMPYYMPEMAEQILQSRVRHRRGFFVPGPEAALRSFLYHVIYHKGDLSGIETGFALKTIARPARDFAEEIRRLALEAGVTLAEPFSLRGLHDHLRDAGWNMATDLLLRWPGKNPVIPALVDHEMQRNQHLLDRTGDLTIFVMRDDGGSAEAEKVAREVLDERFVILHAVRPDAVARQRLMFQTRGGNWTDKGSAVANAPVLALICRSRGLPGPLIGEMSASKIKRRYPLVANTDVLLKRVVRDRVRALPGVGPKAAVLHATDNAIEALETLRALFGDDLEGLLSDL